MIPAKARFALLLALLLPLFSTPRLAQAAGADRIDSPSEGSTVSGRVEVRGTALSDGSSFRSYRLEFGLARTPVAWRPIGPERDHTVDRGVLGLWETEGLPAGEYTIRLTVFDEAGHVTQVWVRVFVRSVMPVGTPLTAPSTASSEPTPAPDSLPTQTAEAATTSVPTLIEPGPAASAETRPEPVSSALEEEALAQPIPPAPQPPRPLGRPLRCPMLYYHEVPRQADLASQLTAFLQAGYRPVSMGRVVDALEGRANPPPPGCLVLTFDDGLASQISGALPVLLRFHLTATFFVMPGFRDGVHRYMSADDLRTLRDAGMEIGSHTLNHPSLPALQQANFEAFEAEIVTSKSLLEAELERRVDLLAYPNGAWDYASADEIRRAGYRAAASTMPGAWQRPEDLFWLRRIRADPWEPVGAVLARLAR